MKQITSETTPTTLRRSVSLNDHVPFVDLRAAAEELRQALATAAARTIESGAYVGGQEVAAFEAAWGLYCSTAHCVGTGNGLDALRRLPIWRMTH